MLDFSPDGRLLAAAYRPSIVRLFDPRTGKLLLKFENAAGDVRALAFSPDSRRLATGNADTTILVWDIQQLIDRYRPEK